jgi:hypothetical protein
LDKNVIRILSLGAVIASDAFGKLDAAKQTLTLAQASGKTILFVDSFKALSSGDTIAKKLLGGEDVSLELEFNGINLTEDQTTALKTVRPLFSQIAALKPAGYIVESEAVRQTIADTGRFSFSDTAYVRGHAVGGNSTFPWVTKAMVKRLYEAWIKFNLKGETTLAQVSIDGTRRAVLFTSNGITIGCQSFSKAEIDYVAASMYVIPASVYRA